MFRWVKLDIKLAWMAVAVWLAMDVLVLLVCLCLFPGDRNAWLTLELLLPFGGVWPGVFLAGELWRRSSRTELFLSCNRRFGRIIIVKYLCFTAFGTLCQTAVAALVCLPADRDGGGLLLLLVLAECLAFAGTGLFLMALLRDAGWTAALLLCVLAGDYGTQGRLFGRLHFSLYWYEELTAAVILPRVAVAGALAVLSMGAAFLLLCLKNGMVRLRS